MACSAGKAAATLLIGAAIGAAATYVLATDKEKRSEQVDRLKDKIDELSSKLKDKLGKKASDIEDEIYSS